MKFAKKSLGQNFLIDKNIIKKIVNLTDVKNRHIVEVGPGRGALTREILKRKPKSLILIEKDYQLAKDLKKEYIKNKIVKIYNTDILKFDLEKIVKKNSAIFGNLPYNISSQILVKIIKFNIWPPKFNDLIFMFQKELGEKILSKHPSSSYGRLSILRSSRLNILKSFLISPNCFFPKPKIISMVIYFNPIKKNIFKFKNIKNLEKITNIFFSNKRKMINKNIKKLLSSDKINKISSIKLNLRPSDLKPSDYFRITEMFEKD